MTITVDQLDVLQDIFANHDDDGSNVCMRVYAGDGEISITKEQAMKFFGLVEAS